MFSKVLWGSSSNALAISNMRSGMKVPSVSMYTTFPFSPLFSNGSWAMTQSIKQIWVLPTPYSPMSSVMA